MSEKYVMKIIKLLKTLLSLAQPVAVKKITNTKTTVNECWKVRGQKVPARGAKILTKLYSHVQARKFDVRKHGF